MEQTQIQSERPSQVATAIKLLYTVLWLIALQTFIMVYQSAETISVSSKIFQALISIGITLFLIYNLRKARNWARITLLICYILTVPFQIYAILIILTTRPNLYATYPASGLIRIIQLTMQITALVLLFQKSSSEWFKQNKATK